MKPKYKVGDVLLFTAKHLNSFGDYPAGSISIRITDCDGEMYYYKFLTHPDGIGPNIVSHPVYSIDIICYKPASIGKIWKELNES